MITEKRLYATGTILPLGDGLTGKTVISKILINPQISTIEHSHIIERTRKSLNIEFEFSNAVFQNGESAIHTSLQYYIFPGQRQKTHKQSSTFEEIINIFGFFPALEKISVLLLIHDSSRINTLKSLELWLKIALEKKWLYENSLVVLVNNKIDLYNPDESFINQIKNGIYSLVQQKDLQIDKNQIKTINTSCITLEGISELRNMITEWIATKGKYGIGTI